MNLFLIGYRGSGKTTIAAALAERLGWPWVDADTELERRAAKSIKQIFAEGGENAFRDLESAIVAELARGDQQIVALGGGAILREKNRAVLAGRGKIIWLEASPETLWRRINSDPATAERRPNLTSQGGVEEIRQLLDQRSPIYASCADLVLDADDKPPGQIADEILAALSLKE